MAKTKDETASFVIRVTQKIYESDEGEAQVQWRGNIQHVQGGDEKRFIGVDQAIAFMQEKLTDMTLKALEDKSPEEQKGILAKSFDLWKKVAATGPKMLVDTIKDPQRQVAHIQEQLQDQFAQVKEELGQKLELDTWLASSKSDSRLMMEQLAQLSEQVAALHEKIDSISQK